MIRSHPFCIFKPLALHSNRKPRLHQDEFWVHKETFTSQKVGSAFAPRKRILYTPAATVRGSRSAVIERPRRFLQSLATLSRHSDWKPFALSTGLATGPPRNWMSDFASSTTLLEGPIPAVKTVVLANSPGSGPSNSAPSTGTISEACPTPI